LTFLGLGAAARFLCVVPTFLRGGAVDADLATAALLRDGWEPLGTPLFAVRVAVLAPEVAVRVAVLAPEVAVRVAVMAVLAVLAPEVAVLAVLAPEVAVRVAGGRF